MLGRELRRRHIARGVPLLSQVDCNGLFCVQCSARSTGANICHLRVSTGYVQANLLAADFTGLRFRDLFFECAPSWSYVLDDMFVIKNLLYHRTMQIYTSSKILRNQKNHRTTSSPRGKVIIHLSTSTKVINCPQYLFTDAGPNLASGTCICNL
jgi:hypothetical protein